MMKWSTLALAAAVSLGIAHTSSAAPVAATGLTTVQLFDLGVPVAPLGSAIDNGNGSYSFPVTGLEEIGGATTLFHAGSGLRINNVLDIENFSYTLGNPLTLPITLFGTANGAGPVDLFSLDSADDELPLTIALTNTSAAALGLTPDLVIGNVTGVEFQQAVPEPTSLLLLGTALAFAATRGRRP